MKTKLSAKEKLNLFSNLNTMLTAGIPILETVETLHDEEKGNLKKVLANLSSDISQGKTMAESFSEFEGTFDPVEINLVAAAEESGNLEEILKNLTENTKRNMEFSSKVKGAMLYPLVLFVLFLGIMVVILTYVVPRIADVFLKLKMELPLPTRTLIAMSDFFLNYWLYVIIGGLLLMVLCVALYVSKKRQFVNFLLSLPLLSRLGNELDLVQFTRSFGLLLKSGIPISTALGSTRDVVSKRKISRAIDLARKDVEAGKELSEGMLRSKKIFPPVMMRIVQAGEKSGQLEESMLELADRLENQVSGTLKTITTLLEPFMLVVMGLFVGGIMLSIIAPIYQLIGNITPR